MYGTHLTTSRINRVLRPLRTKCDKLASISQPSGIKVTYSTRTRVNSIANKYTDDTPPLATLPPPESLQSKLQLGADSRKQIELSRNIYAIRDAFKNIIQVAFGLVTGDRQNSTFSSSESSNLLTLSSLCCVVVGLELGNGHGTSPNQDDNEEGGEKEDVSDGSSWTDELYDEVPFHTRKWTVVTHALQLILRTCPHHHTLLVCLLDLCLSYISQCSLIPHCQSLLQALLQVVFTSPSNPNAVSPLPPPICHTAHVSYLVDLKGKCRKANFGNERSFISALLQILSTASPEAWTSKALVKLARDVANYDLTCLVRLATGLTEVISKTKREKSKPEKRSNARKLDLLLRWCQSIFDHLMFTARIDEDEDVCLAVLELSFTYVKSRYPPEPLLSSELEDIMMCIITWCLASLPPSFSDRDLNNVVNILVATNASRSVYSPLVSRIFSSATEDDVPVKCLDEIRSFAHTLRFNRLFRLEALFMNHASTYFEKAFMMTLGHEPEFEEIVEELAKIAAEAEMRSRDHGHEDGLSDQLPSTDCLEPPPPPPVKKRKRSGPRDGSYLLEHKRQRRDDRGGSSRLHARSQSRQLDDEIIDISDSHPGLGEIPKGVTCYDSDQTPEVQAEMEGSDDERHSALSLSFQTSSSDDLLDLFACPDTSPIALRRQNG